MISIETEARIAKLLLTLADGEREVETIRQVLAKQLGFDSYNIFRVLDKSLKNNLDEYDVYTFLKPLNVFSTLEELKSIVLFYDCNADGNLSYLEFINIIVTETDYALRRISQEKPYTYTSKVPYFSYEIEYSLVKLLERELELVRSLQLLIKDLNLRYDYNPYKLFSQLDEFNLNYITLENIQNFLSKNGVEILNSEAAAIFKRLDIDRDNRISLWEFNRVFSLSTSGTKPATSSLSTSISQNRKDIVQATTNSFYRDSPLKTNKTTFLSPVRESSRVNQSLSKSVNRSIDLNISNLKDSAVNSNNSSGSNNFSQSFINRSKFSTYEEELFVEYLRETLVNERETERLKSLLAMRPDFNLRDLFRVFQFNNFSYLNISDIKLGFNQFNVFPTNEEIELLVKRYDGTNVLSSFAFNDMLLPVDLEYNSMMKNRLGYDYHLKYCAEIFSFETRFCIENLFKALVNTEVSAEAWRQKFFLLKTFDSRIIFDKIDYYAKNYITSEDFIRNFKINAILYNSKDMDLIFYKLDKNRDNRISYTEFSEELFPKSRDFLLRNSLI